MKNKSNTFLFVATIKKILAPLSGDGKNTAKTDMEQIMVKLQPIITMATIGKNQM